MDGSHWPRLPVHDQEGNPVHVPTKRGCIRCDRAAELIEVTTGGTAVYLCPERHPMLVDVAKATRLR